MTFPALPLLSPVEVPLGDPEALREAARTYEGSAEQARQISLRVRQTVSGTVGARWSGVASSAFLSEGERISGSHDAGVRVLEQGAVALYQYAHELEGAQREARHAGILVEDYNRQVTQLRAEQHAAATDPVAQAHVNGQTEQLAAEHSRATSTSARAQQLAREAAGRAAGTFGAVTSGALSLLVPGAGAALVPKAVADSILGLRKEFKVARAANSASRLAAQKLAGSTDEALARWLGAGGSLGRYASKLQFVGRFAPAAGIPLGIWQAVHPGGEGVLRTGNRAAGVATAAASGILTVSAFGGMSALAALGTAGAVLATTLPAVAAGVLVGVALYEVGKLVYKHWDDIKSGVAKAVQWTGDKLGRSYVAWDGRIRA